MTFFSISRWKCYRYFVFFFSPYILYIIYVENIFYSQKKTSDSSSHPGKPERREGMKPFGTFSRMEK